MSQDSEAARASAGAVARSPRHRRHHRLEATIVAALVVVGLLAAGCGGGSSGPGVAAGTTTRSGSGSGSAGSGNSSSSSNSFDALAFAQCIRKHGVPDFPDPNSSGLIDIQVRPGSDLSPGSPKFQAAQKACAKYAPGGNLTPAQKAQQQAQLLKYAQCMRAHGLSDFPDPSADGGLALKGGPGGDLNPNSPTFQAAQKECQSNLPGLLKGGGGVVFRGGGPGGGKAPSPESAGSGSGGSGGSGGVVAP